jgi:spore coat polysaccharide biosynthesis protein SpsF
MNVVAIVDASLGPEGKGPNAMTQAHGQPLLGHVLDRLERAGKLSRIVVTTSDGPADEAIIDYCTARETICLKGPRDDLLGRVLSALTSTGAKGGVMVGGCSPLIDPAIVDHVVNLLQMTDGMLDWVGNTASPPTYPQGMEIDGFTTAAITESDKRCADVEQRRQGPAFLRQNSRLYRLLAVSAPKELERPQVNLKVAGADDLPRIESVLAHFGTRTDYSLAEILAFVDKSDCRTG